jgi:hypothetical protein
LAAERKKKANFKKNYIMKAHYLEAFFWIMRKLGK